MKKLAIITLIPLLVLGCTATPEKIELKNTVKQQNNIEPVNNTIAVKPICSNPQDVKYHVFHSMYADQQYAENAYSHIIANTSEPQFLQLMAHARNESIDSDSRDIGGDLGYIKIASFDKSFGTAVSHLPLKKLSHPIQSKFGWHLVWVSDALDIKTNMPCR
jgi:hypothetical protein